MTEPMTRPSMFLAESTSVAVFAEYEDGSGHATPFTEINACIATHSP
jgi:hypothetical protein